MTLRLRFSGFNNFETSIVVEWKNLIKDFPSFCSYGGKYWGAQFYDNDDTGQAQKVLLLSEYTKEALPIDMYGNPFPVTDLTAMFGLGQSEKECECGQKGVSGARHSDYCPRYNP